MTTLLGECDDEDGKKFLKSSVEESGGEEKRAETAAIETKIAEMKQEEKPSKSGLKEQNKKLEQAKKDLSELERKFRKVGGLQRSEDGTIDYSEDFFGEKTFLTVSGQLAVETYACALSNVYTFGPTFRAEDSYTTRHLAEFWMIEPELAFADLNDDMQCAEDYVRHCCKYLLKTCRKDLEFFQKMYDKNCLERVENVANNPFGRVSYTEAIEILKDAIETKKKEFMYPVEWGIDLATEHERYLAEEVYKKPVVVYNYPKDIKAFYMRLNPDGKTVAAMDILVPKVGELVGGSQREERLDVLEQRMKDCGLELEEYSWYLDLRRYGSVTHSGFGLGFERLILFTTGMENIRDVIPYPRWPKNCLEGHYVLSFITERERERERDQYYYYYYYLLLLRGKRGKTIETREEEEEERDLKRRIFYFSKKKTHKIFFPLIFRPKFFTKKRALFDGQNISPTPTAAAEKPPLPSAEKKKEEDPLKPIKDQIVAYDPIAGEEADGGETTRKEADMSENIIVV